MLIFNKIKTVDDWWDPKGYMKGLHAYNKIRVPYIIKNVIQYAKSQE